jgi:hypothetical protein
MQKWLQFGASSSGEGHFGFARTRVDWKLYLELCSLVPRPYYLYFLVREICINCECGCGHGIPSGESSSQVKYLKSQLKSDGALAS